MMKRLFILLSVFASTISFGQITDSKTPGLQGKIPNNDTSLRVVYVDRNKQERQPAFFINGKYVMSQSLLNSLDPNKIEDVQVFKRDTMIENITYSGQIYIKTKSNYVPKPISLTELKNKYTDFEGKPVVFMLDGNFLNTNYDTYTLDENNLLTIIVDKLQTEKEKIDIGLIKLLTKSKENIENRNRIILRGKEVSLKN